MQEIPPLMNDFSEYALSPPDVDATREVVDALLETLLEAGDATAALPIIEAWDKKMTEFREWSMVTYIRFMQDTKNPAHKEAKELLDSVSPKFTDLETRMKQAVLELPYRDQLAERVSPQCLDLWTCHVASFAPAIEEDLAAEARLDSQYTEVLAAGEVVIQRESLNLSEVDKYTESNERAIRKEAFRARSEWFAQQGEILDQIYADQVTLRHRMARTLHYPSYTELAYQQRTRIGFGPEDVAAFRDEVANEVVPLVSELASLQRKELEVDELMYWDEATFTRQGNPKPLGDHDWMVDRATEMFAEMGHGMDDFFHQMKSKGLMDLNSRPGKAGGGFCEYLHGLGMPFIFANFNGTRHDVGVFTHEMGHAFQAYSSRDQPLADLVWPTTEACEIHSIGLEFLTWPHMHLFYGEEAAARLKRAHLHEYLTFLPYGVSVDHFQHLVYAQPDATPEERHGFWKVTEERYMPETNYGNLPAESAGRRWQMKPHLYGLPFYYIDYTLAVVGALQFWSHAREDTDAAMREYVALCRRGGSLPFAELLKSAGLSSPFEPGCLKGLMAEAKAYLLH